MIYQRPPAEDATDQGDIVDGCPVAPVARFDPDRPEEAETVYTPRRVLVLTQTCDLANQKATRAVVAVVLDAQQLVDEKILKRDQIKGPIIAGRVWGWYFLPKSIELGLPEMIVDLRLLHTARLDILADLCRRGQRRARVQPLYREHLAKHFVDIYSRIGLPEPYQTD